MSFLSKHYSSRAPMTNAETLSQAILSRVEVEQMDVSLRLVPYTVATSISVAEIIVWLFWQSNVRLYLVILQICLLLFSVVIFRRCYKWRVEAKPIALTRSELRLTLLVSQLFGWTLASIPWMLFVSANGHERLLIAASCAGLIATGMSMAVMPIVAIQFSGPIVISSFVTLLSAKDSYYNYVAILLVFYAAFLLVTVRSLSRLVTNWVTAQGALERQQQLTSLILNDFEEGASDWLWETDEELRLQHVSPRLIEVAGNAARNLQNLPLTELFRRDAEKAKPFELLWSQIGNRREFVSLLLPVCVDAELRWWCISGKPIFESTGAFLGYRGVGSDVTDKKRSEEKLSYLAMHDQLTELPNRASFLEHLEKARRDFETRGKDFAVLCLDLDHFKSVNDTYGHSAGDTLLQMVAMRLQTLVGSTAIIARMAGDEFAVIVTSSSGAILKVAGTLASRIVTLLDQPFRLGEFTANVGCSIGIAVASEDGEAEIMRLADLALYRVKHAGGDSYRFYEAEMDARIEARRALAADLRGALERGEFFLNFQPLVAATSLQVEAFEALARWKHPRRGLIPPAEFIKLAEESGMIIPIGEWILRQACRTAAMLPGDIHMAVNLSPIQLRHSSLVHVVRSALEEAGLPAGRLELEVTESVFLEPTPTMQTTLGRLRELGVGLSLDDFGVGYSSLSYLRRKAFNKIKVDSAFVRDLPNERGDVAIIRAIVNIASALGMTVTAEGVETEEQCLLLRQFGCHQLQGYLFSKPVSTEKAIESLKRLAA
jgi:diguanylate cyclase (GGDEF)-like protein/PAS domain S-box-containing protein